MVRYALIASETRSYLRRADKYEPQYPDTLKPPAFTVQKTRLQAYSLRGQPRTYYRKVSLLPKTANQQPAPLERENPLGVFLIDLAPIGVGKRSFIQPLAAPFGGSEWGIYSKQNPIHTEHFYAEL